MSDDKKNIFDSATVIMPSPKAQKAERRPPASPVREKSVTDIADIAEFQEITQTRSSALGGFKHPKLFGLVIGLLVIGIVHTFWPLSEPVSTPNSAQVVAQPDPLPPPPPPPVTKAPETVQAPKVEPEGLIAPRHPATTDFLRELELGMRQAADK